MHTSEPWGVFCTAQVLVGIRMFPRNPYLRYSFKKFVAKVAHALASLASEVVGRPYSRACSACSASQHCRCPSSYRASFEWISCNVFLRSKLETIIHLDSVII